jgi:mitogen-activated protein kinase kinase kinase 7
VIERLEPLSVNFASLPGLVQRAVLWDSGFAISPGNDAVQVWTLDSYTMANLAASKTEACDAECTFVDCVQLNNVTVSYVQGCTGDQMLCVSRCVVDTFEDSGAGTFLGSMWSNGRYMALQIRLREHSWTDPVQLLPFSLYAVHTVPGADDVTWNQCAAGGEYASLTVPCYRRDNVTSQVEAAMSKPSGSAWVTTWLEDELAEESSSFDKLLLVPIILGVVALIGAIALGCVCWRRQASGDRSNRRLKTAMLTTVLVVLWRRNTPRLTDRSSQRTTLESAPSRKQRGYSSAGPSKTLKILLGSEHLQGKRIPYESIVFERTISKGASGEVWICELNGQKVAAKRLPQTKDQKAEHVQAFAQEIELSASLVHPNIVEFIGVAWNSLNNLVMVLEFFPTDNLQSYLHKNADLLSWARDKIHVAIVAQVLEYLHARSPPLIHRDLKSNNWRFCTVVWKGAFSEAPATRQPSKLSHFRICHLRNKHVS